MSRIGRIGLIGLIVAIAAAISASAAMATTVTPAGEGFTATITPGTEFEFKAGLGETKCKSVVAVGSVPAAPGNSNPGGSVSTAIEGESAEAPEITECEAHIFGVGAGEAEAVTSGEWEVTVNDEIVLNEEEEEEELTAMITAPFNGIVMENFVLGADCIAEGIEGEEVSLKGTWVNGSGTTPPMINIEKQKLPTKIHGAFFCEEETEAEVSGHLMVEGTSGSFVTVELP